MNAFGRISGSFILFAVLSLPADAAAQPELIYVGRNNDVAGVEKLLAKGVDPNAPGQSGRIPIIEAAGNCATDVVRLLIKRGADIRKEGPDGFGRPGSTALIEAVGFGCAASVELLLQAGADANAIASRPLTPFSDDGHSLLGYAIAGPGYTSRPPRIDRLGVVRALISAGANVNFKNAKGQTPLMLAAASSKSMDLAVMPQIYAALCAAGADLKQQGGAAVQAAAFAGNTEFAQRIRADLQSLTGSSTADSRQSSSRPMNDAKFEELNSRMKQSPLSPEALRFLLEKEASASAQQLNKLLITAAIYDRLEVIPYLLEIGANINCRDDLRQFTPLMHAAQDKNPATLRLLLANGADPNAASDRGVTPLSIAADKGIEQSVEALLQGGADPTIAEQFRGTPLAIARERGFRGIEEKLAAASASRPSPVHPGEIDRQAALLSSTEPRDRATALQFFWDNAPYCRAAVPALITAATGPHPSTCWGWECMENTTNFQDEARSVLGRIGPSAAPAVPTLIKLLEDGTLEVHRKEVIVKALRQIRDPSAVPALIELLRGGTSRDLREEAVAALGAIGSAAAPALPELRRMLANSDRSLRDKVLAAVSAIDGGKSVPLEQITAVFKDGSQQAKLQAVRTIGGTGPSAQPAVDAIIAEIFGWIGGNEQFIDEAAAALKQIDPQGQRTIPLAEKYRDDSGHGWKAKRILKEFGR